LVLSDLLHPMNLSSNPAPATLAFDEGNVEITIDPSALSDLNRDVVSNGDAACGVLIGQKIIAGKHISFSITMYLSVMRDQRVALSEDLKQVSDIVETWAELPTYPKAVGICAHPGSESRRPFQPELASLGKYLGESPGLLVVPKQDSLHIFLTRDTKGRWPQTTFALPTIPAPEPTVKTKPTPSERSSKTSHALSAQPSSVTAATETRAKTKSALILGFSVLSMIIAICALAMAYFYVQPTAPRETTKAALPSKPQGVEPTAPASQLRLKVTRLGSDLQITWDRDAEMIRIANQASLHLKDGEAQTRIDLDRSQLRTGRVLYVPRSTDVTIRLEILTSGNVRLDETLRVLQARLNNGSIKPVMKEPVSAGDSEMDSRNRMEEAAQTIQDVQPKTSILPNRSISPISSGAPKMVNPPLAGTHTTNPAMDNPAALTSLPTNPLQSSPPPFSLPQAPAQEGPISPPRVVRQAAVTLSPTLRAMIVRDVTIQVKLSIDETGRVQQVSPINQGDGINAQLAAHAVAAAKLWRFAPASRAGIPVPGEYTVAFRFRKP
jgi:hypothetical protein